MRLTTRVVRPLGSLRNTKPWWAGRKRRCRQCAQPNRDGANQLGELAPGGVRYADYTGYIAGVVRTPGYVAAAWERVKPFALASGDQYRPGPPAVFGSAEQKVIAEYWADGPNSELPPGHWLLFEIQGEALVPYQLRTFPTPPFPEHVSGHSTFSAAAAFGASHTKLGRSMVLEPDLPASDLTLSWATFSAAAEEAGMSRIYGGIHFDNGNAAGRTLGRQVAAQVFAKAQALWLGTA